MVDEIICNVLVEDIGDGDYFLLVCIFEKVMGVVKLLVKDFGIFVGVELVKWICELFDL